MDTYLNNELTHWCAEHHVAQEAAPLITEDFDRELDDYAADLAEYGL